VDECKEAEKKWEDPMFKQEEANGLKPMELHKIPACSNDDGDTVVFDAKDNEAKPTDVFSGEMSNDSYLMSILSSLAQNPKRVKKLFHATEFSE